jgi:hypothetical protein
MVSVELDKKAVNASYLFEEKFFSKYKVFKSI